MKIIADKAKKILKETVFNKKYPMYVTIQKKYDKKYIGKIVIYFVYWNF